MAGRTPEEAVEAFLDPLRQAVLCITDQPFLANGYKPSVIVHVAAFAPTGFPVPLHSRFGRNSIRSFISHRYRIVGLEHRLRDRWTVRTVAYDYGILDRQGAEILVYHWHPEDVGPSYPHLHLSGSLAPLPIGERLPSVPLGDMHLPTEQMALASVIRLLIEEFGVPARKSEPEWQAILTSAGRPEQSGP